MFSLYIFEVPVDGLDHQDLVPISSDQSSRAGALNEEPFVDGLVEEWRKQVLRNHVHQCRCHWIFLGVVHLRSLLEFAKGTYDETIDVNITHTFMLNAIFFLLYFCMWSTSILYPCYPIQQNSMLNHFVVHKHRHYPVLPLCEAWMKGWGVCFPHVVWERSLLFLSRL